jgi:Tol biopolymer transport system component
MGAACRPSPRRRTATPSWSPDGKRIAFETDRDGNSEIYVMNADGSGQHRLTWHPAGSGYPDWSPGGNRIAFESGRAGGWWQIYVMDADGYDQHRVS